MKKDGHMTDNGMKRIRDLFEQLDAWRHLPAYRLEARADAFFGLYMREVLAAHLGRELHGVVIPELPLRRGTLFGEEAAGPNQSVKVDYALFGAGCEVGYLVELKTDQGSRREEQDAYLGRARELGMAAILEGIVKIVEATSAVYRPKYLHLLARLEELGLIRLSPEARAAGRVAAKDVVIEERAREMQLDVLYVQPHSDGSAGVIGFEEFARLLPAQDPVAELFREYLLRWREPAGASSAAYSG